MKHKRPKNKLEGSYLDEYERDFVNCSIYLRTSIFTGLSLMLMEGLKTLADQDLKQFKKDLELSKSFGDWDTEEERRIFKEHYKQKEIEKKVKLLSPADQVTYYYEYWKKAWHEVGVEYTDEELLNWAKRVVEEDIRKERGL